ncbi:MAG: VWA domain-containing protein [Myxococcota bacterium]|nr:VWA domain-containing protein [Myxococcota bacterium]
MSGFAVERAWVLWLLIVPVLVTLVGIRGERLARSRLGRLVAPRLQPRLVARSPGGSWRHVVIGASLAALVTALAGVRYGDIEEEVRARGVDVMVALDVSDSMLARDVESDAGLSRLERARREILDLLARLDGDRIGLVIFAGDAVLQLPLTLDYEAAALFVREVAPELVSTKGTAIAKAIDVSINAFEAGVAEGRAVILITDGEDTEGDVAASAEKAKQAGVRVFGIGVGRSEGAPIPLAGGGFRRDRKGEMVLSRLDEAQLASVANATGGDVVRSTSGDYDLERIYAGIKTKVASRDLGSRRRVHGKDRYRVLVSLAAAGLMLEALLRGRRAR